MNGGPALHEPGMSGSESMNERAQCVQGMGSSWSGEMSGDEIKHGRR